MKKKKYFNGDERFKIQQDIFNFDSAFSQR